VLLPLLGGACLLLVMIAWETRAPDPQTHGYVLSFRVGAAVLAGAGLLALVLLERVTAQPRVAVAEVPADQAPTAELSR